jgi:nucleotide-binding universal stress UspA family protein
MKVLVATDGSDAAMKAVRRALDMAEVKGAEVTIISVAYFIKDYFDDMPPNIQDKLEGEARAALEKARALFSEKNLKVTTVLERGPVPANNIINFAKEGNFDSIVIGTTGQHGLQTVLMGSTAAKVASHAPCEVVVAR